MRNLYQKASLAVISAVPALAMAAPADLVPEATDILAGVGAVFAVLFAITVAIKGGRIVLGLFKRG